VIKIILSNSEFQNKNFFSIFSVAIYIISSKNVLSEKYFLIFHLFFIKIKSPLFQGGLLGANRKKA